MAKLREAQKQLTRQLLFDSALAVFERRGYAAGTIDEIATEAGTTRTTFYLHFASKADLVGQLLQQADHFLTSDDRPGLNEVVRSGDPDAIREWLNARFEQWPTLKPYLTVSHAASHEPDVAQAIDRWYEDVVSQMVDGLDQAERFDPAQRRIRCVLAFGQFEFLSRRFFVAGWRIDRQLCLDALTDSWRYLLTEG